MVFSSRFYKLESHVRHYDWGMRRHGDSMPYIAQLLGEDPGKNIPWAELWIGAHPSLSSDVLTDSGSCRLDMALADDMAALGTLPSCVEPGKLPFLLKILSCERALSIQSHPDKATAEMLHAQFPGNYPDDNHKPEMMIAITPFEALAGFRPLEDALAELDALESVAPWRNVWREAREVTLKTLCETLLNIPAGILRDILVALHHELMQLGDRVSDAGRLFIRLLDFYPCDRGALFAFLLNHLTMQPGEAMFIPANVPHAYLCGTGIECMANSDNVIRAGLTRKYVDTRRLLSTLVFDGKPMALTKGTMAANGARVYETPVREFKVTVFEGDSVFDLSSAPGKAAVILVLDGGYVFESGNGTAQTGRRGTTWFRPAHMAVGCVRPLEKNSRLVIAELGD